MPRGLYLPPFQRSRYQTEPGVAAPDVTVVIVNYNVREFLQQALTSVQRASAGLVVETIVIDNDSADGSAEMVQSQFPDVQLTVNRQNVGFGAANNQAIRAARGRHVLLLNPDTILQEDSLRVLASFLDATPDAGAVGCRILNPDGSFALESRRSFPTPAIAFARMTGLSKLFPRSRFFGRYNLTFLPTDERCEVDALSGSCMMIRRDALIDPETGAARLLFDEQFFMYGEDLDLCYRIQRDGWRLYFEPATQIIHYKGESTKKGDLRYVKLFYGAMLLFAQKHFKGRNAGLLILLLRAGILGRAAISATGRLLRRLAPAILDLILSSASFAGVALWRFGSDAIPPQLLTTVTPVFSISVVALVAVLGGYRFGQRTKLRYAVVAPLVGLVVVAALSFFLKQIAFSRFVVGLGAPLSAACMSLWRLVWRGDRERSRRAILVGSEDVADRLQTTLLDNPQPPLTLAGYVDTSSDRGRTEQSSRVRNLGKLSQLRDIARFESAGCIVFVPGALKNEEIFGWMQRLRDLPLQFKMLGSTESHVIGKSSVDELALPSLVEADQALGLARGRTRHRLFDVAVASALLLSTPVLLLARSLGSRKSAVLLSRFNLLLSVIVGRRSIVGFDEQTEYRPPVDYGIKPGLFAVSESVECQPDMDRRYGYYAMRQSAAIDWAIVRRRLSEDVRTQPGGVAE